MENKPEIAHLIPFFYPSSQNIPPDPTSTAIHLADYLQSKPIATGALASDLPTFLLEVASAHPAHTDQILYTIKHLLDIPTLPLINNWDLSRPNATFAEMFHVAFRDDLNDAVRGPVEASDRALYIAGSIAGGRARSLGMLNTPEMDGMLAEGLKFSDDIRHFYLGEQAEIALIGSCLQLLGGASPLLESQSWRFTKDRILAALDGVEYSAQNNALLQFTKTHIRKEPVVDLTSEEIVDNLTEVGWHFSSDEA